MALWGKTDALASAPKWVVPKAVFSGTVSAVDTTADTIDLTNANTNFATGEAVVYTNGGGTSITGLTSGSTYYVRKSDAYKITLYDTQAHAVAGGATGLVNITAVGVGAAHTLQATAAGNVNNHTFGATALYFVDAAEAVQPLTRAKGIKNPGWWLYSSHSNADGSTGQLAECLVAMNGSDVDLAPATTGDQADDTVAADAIVISSQPSNITGATTPYTGTFAVTASVAPSTTLTYQWQRSTDGTTWANITNAAPFSTATTATLNLTAAAKATYNGNSFRCVVSAVGHTDVTSNAATITYA